MSGCILGAREGEHMGGCYFKSRYLQFQRRCLSALQAASAEWETRTALAGRAWQPIKPAQFPRSSRFVIVCASQVETHSSGQEELPEHPGSKTDSTLVSGAGSRKLTPISPLNPPAPGACRAAPTTASSPPRATHQRGPARGHTSRRTQGLAVAWRKSEGMGPTALWARSPRAEGWQGEATRRASPRAGWGERKVPVVNVSPSRAKSTFFYRAGPKGGPRTARRALPQHQHPDLSSQHSDEPGRPSSARNRRQNPELGTRGRGQPGRVLRAESLLPDKSLPYYTWQPPTATLPEGSLKSPQGPFPRSSSSHLSLTCGVSAGPTTAGPGPQPLQGARARDRGPSLPAPHAPTPPAPALGWLAANRDPPRCFCRAPPASPTGRTCARGLRAVAASPQGLTRRHNFRRAVSDGSGAP